MNDKVTVIKMRWWGHVLSVVTLLLLPAFSFVMGSVGIDLLGEPGWWWKALILMAGASVFLLAFVQMLNVTFTYRLEIDSRSLRLVGNLWTHVISWQEIARISKRRHPRSIALGYYVLIEVDGSRLPRRHWSRLWVAGYQIPTPMEKGPSELTVYLKRKRREYLKRAQAAPASIDA